MTPVTCPNPLPTAIEGALGAGQSGADLVTFDLTDPVVPTPRGRVTNGSADGVLQGGFLYARDASGALVVQDLRPPGGPSDVGSLLP
jgi:hypothetical protein